jgi:hypothetical protein
VRGQFARLLDDKPVGMRHVVPNCTLRLHDGRRHGTVLWQAPEPLQGTRAITIYVENTYRWDSQGPWDVTLHVRPSDTAGDILLLLEERFGVKRGGLVLMDNYDCRYCSIDKISDAYDGYDQEHDDGPPKFRAYFTQYGGYAGD